MYSSPPQHQPPPPPPPPPPLKLSLHKHKLIALIIAAVALIGMILPWANISMGGLGSRSAGNGFQGWGLLSLFGLIAVIVACLAADKLTSFDSNMRNLAIGGFAGITLGAFIAFMQLNGSSQLNMTVKSGIGIWFTVIAGTIGLLSVTGIIKFDNIGQSFKNPNPPVPPHHPNYPPYPPQQPPYPPPPNYPQYPPPPPYPPQQKGPQQ